MKVKSKKVKVKNRLSRFGLYFALFVALSPFLLFSPSSVAAQTGGTFQITQSVTATGGTSSGGNYTIESTAGQTLAGGLPQAGGYSIYSGFWTPPDLIPTAATVSIGGRVTAANGIGIRNAILSLTDSGGIVRRTRTAAFGYFSFDEVRVGETYVLSIQAKRFIFSHPTRILNVSEELNGIDFVAEN